MSNVFNRLRRQHWALLLTFVSIGVIIVASTFLPGGFLSHAAATGTSHSNQSQSQDLKREEAAWFQLSHFGSGPVSPDARIQAFTQANQLAQISSTSTLTSPPPFWTKPWRPLGPAPINSNCGAFCNNNGLVSGRVTAEAVDPNNNQEVWVGTPDGGVWKSIDGGAHWTPKTDKQPTLAVGSIAVDPNNPPVIYVGTGEANFNGDSYWGIGILKSTDDGATWKRYGLKQFGGLAIGRIAIDPANSHILLLSVATSNNNPRPPTTLANLGIWRSTDGGLTWTQVLSGTDGTEVLFDPANPNIAFAGLGSGTSASGVYKSTNAGLTWTLISSGLPTGTAVERVSLGTSLNGSHLYAVLTATNPFGDLLGSAIFVSTDTGITWTAKSVPVSMAQDCRPNPPDCGHQWWYESVDAVDQSDSTGNTAYIGGIDFWKTTDGGNTWTNITQATTPGKVHAVHPDQHALVFPSTKSSSYYIGNDGGVWRGTASGTFTDLNTGGLNITQFYGGGIGNVGPDAQLYGGTQDNGTNQYPAGPISGLKQWNTVLFGDGGNTVVDYTNNAIVYAETPHISLFKSVDGGTSWSQIVNGINPNDPSNFIIPLIMSPSNHNELFTATDRVYRTIDGGATWTPISPALDGTTPISILAVAPSNDNVIYAGDNNGNIFVTTNGGTSWTGGAVPGSTGAMVRGIAVNPHTASTVYVSFANFANGSGHHVFKSTNGGTSWTDISKQLPNIPFSSLLFIKDDLVAGSDAGLFVSENGGSIWWRIDSGLPNVAIDQVFANASGTMLFLATHGRGMWTRSLS